jgi:NitT/TauT family transport system ATP-binding protein
VSRDGAAVQIESVSHRFDKSGDVLQQISLQITPGEFVSILGPSGCGKSTLLRLIADLETPTSGKIVGTQANKSFVFQEATLLPWRTALKNVELPLEFGSHHISERQHKAAISLSAMGLSDSLNKFPQELSGGMKMRVAVARAMVTDPSLLLLDEPFAALDENNRHSLQYDLRNRWIETGSTILFVTHSISEAVYLSDRLIILSGSPGRIIADHRVSLPRRRDEELRLSVEFLREVQKVHAIVRGNPNA